MLGRRGIIQRRRLKQPTLASRREKSRCRGDSDEMDVRKAISCYPSENLLTLFIVKVLSEHKRTARLGVVEDGQSRVAANRSEC